MVELRRERGKIPDKKYELLEKLEDEEDVRESRRIEKEVREGKQKLFSKKEFQEKTGMKL